MPVNLADPDLEPIDEELRELSRSAFADVRERHEEVMRRLRERSADAMLAEKSAGRVRGIEFASERSCDFEASPQKAHASDNLRMSILSE